MKARCRGDAAGATRGGAAAKLGEGKGGGTEEGAPAA
jgi:hypothetical protein